MKKILLLLIIICVSLINEKILLSQDTTQVKKVLLGKIQNRQLELSVDDKDIIGALSEEVSNICIINQILIQIDEDGKYYLYGEGQKGKKHILIHVFLDRDSLDQLFVTSKSKIEYCYTGNGCINVRFDFKEGCDCNKKTKKQSVDYVVLYAFSNEDKGFNKLIVKEAHYIWKK